MAKVCNHTSVYILVERNDKLLVIERKIFPLNYEFPAGHVEEGETYEKAAVRELKEEVGLDATELELIAEGRAENPCSREGGAWHYWKVFCAEASGEIVPSERETKGVYWFTKEELQHLPPPGYAPVMFEWLKEKGII